MINQCVKFDDNVIDITSTGSDETLVHIYYVCAFFFITADFHIQNYVSGA